MPPAARQLAFDQRRRDAIRIRQIDRITRDVVRIEQNEANGGSARRFYPYGCIRSLEFP